MNVSNLPQCLRDIITPLLKLLTEANRVQGERENATKGRIEVEKRSVKDFAAFSASAAEEVLNGVRLSPKQLKAVQGVETELLLIRAREKGLQAKLNELNEQVGEKKQHLNSAFESWVKLETAENRAGYALWLGEFAEGARPFVAKAYALRDRLLIESLKMSTLLNPGKGRSILHHLQSAPRDADMIEVCQSYMDVERAVKTLLN